MNFKICPITYQPLMSGQRYSAEGLHKLSPQLQDLKDFPFTAEQQIAEALQLANKMSIQGVQAKLSAKLNIKKSQFVITDIGGHYILKPQSQFYSQVPENEDLTMRLAATIGIEVPLHGLIYCADGSLTYFIKRFDRGVRQQKLALEDFAQLAGESRDTKYEFSMERLALIIEQYCTFPVLEKIKLLQRTLFNFLVGNEDMHLKNFSLISREGKVELAPAYDFLNTAIVLAQAQEEIALPLGGKKKKLKRSDFIDYFAYERLALNSIVVEEQLQNIAQAIPTWQELIKISFLSPEMQRAYLKVLGERRTILAL